MIDVPSPNPFTPGYGERPHVLAGREQIQELFKNAFVTAQVDRRTPRAIVLVGPRGVGKTALLIELAELAGADDRAWSVVSLEVPRGGHFVRDLSIALGAVRARLTGQRPKRTRLARRSMSGRLGPVGGEIVQEPVQAEPPSEALALQILLEEVIAAAVGADSGFVIALDEAHLAHRDDLNALGHALQYASQRRWPLVAALAGLPELRGIDDSTTYLRERARWQDVLLIDRAAAERALREAAADAGRPMSDAAVEYLASQAGTYPYAVQLYGHYAWRASDRQAVIDMRAAEHAARLAREDLYQGLLRTRFEDAPEMLREYLAALADLIAAGTPAPTSGQVARHLGARTPALSVAREMAISRGYLSARNRQLTFAIPLMAEFVLERYADALDVEPGAVHAPLIAHLKQRRRERARTSSSGHS